MADSAASSDAPASSYAPFAQLIKMLLPSARCVAIYDARAELVWCSDGYERPDLRALLEQQRASETLASRGSVETTPDGVPVFISGLRGASARPLGSLVIELTEGSRSTPSMVVSMLRPVLDCLAGKMDLEADAREARPSDDSSGLDLLLGADESGADTGALQALVERCAQELKCVTAALVVPDKNIELTWSDGGEAAQLLERTQKHLLAWARLNNRALVVNRAQAGAPYKILSCPLRDGSDGVLGLVALFRSTEVEDFEPRDVRILEFVSRKAVAILESEYDSLTSLPNRVIFERRAQRALERSPAALLYVDVDKLAVLNGAFGMSAGDEVIQRVAAIVQRAAGPDALASRVGGDRFAVLLPEGTLGRASEIGAEILAAVSQLGYLRGSEAMQVSASIGIAEAPAGSRLAHVLAAAELACKRAKANGGGRVAAIDEAPAAPRDSLAAAQLREALQSNQFHLEAQPIVGLRPHGAEVLGYELLLRLKNAAGELVAPDKFLEACAQYGLAAAIDRWVLCAAVEALRPHAAMLAESQVFFSINLSAQALDSRKYAAFALETLAGAGLPPSLFCFELKEPAAVAQLGAADALIRELRNAGALVALDDFGSGLSSIAHLKQLSVNYLKIDGAFVRRVGADRVAESIVSAIARAARTLGVPTIAEHVETEAIAEKLREYEVQLGQGFHLGRPQPLADVVQHVVAAHRAPVATSA